MNRVWGGRAPAAGALVHRVAQAVAAAVVRQISAAGLPGDGPELPCVLVPQVDIVARPVHGHPVGPEAGDPVVLRALVEEVSPGGVVDHGGHVLRPQVVGPGNGHVNPVDDILPPGLVKMSVLHRRASPVCFPRSGGVLLLWMSIVYTLRRRITERAMRSFAADCAGGR